MGESNLRDSFFKYLKVERNYSAHTVVAYKRDLQDAQDYFLDFYQISIDSAEAIAGMRVRHFRSWMGSLIQGGIKPRSVGRKLAAMKSYFKFLKKRGKIESNPAELVKTPKFEKKLPAYLKEETTLKLFEEIEFKNDFEGLRNKCILEILYGCGIRRSELMTLKKGDILFDQKLIKVLGKGRKERLVPFGSNVNEALNKYLEVCRIQGKNLEKSLFIRKNNEPLYPKLVYNIVKNVLEKVTTLTNKSPHILRHTFATHLLNAGADLNAIKELLGHKSLAATQVYTHNSISKLKEVYKKAHPKAKSD